MVNVPHPNESERDYTMTLKFLVFAAILAFFGFLIAVVCSPDDLPDDPFWDNPAL